MSLRPATRIRAPQPPPIALLARRLSGRRAPPAPKPLLRPGKLSAHVAASVADRERWPAPPTWRDIDLSQPPRVRLVGSEVTDPAHSRGKALSTALDPLFTLRATPGMHPDAVRRLREGAAAPRISILPIATKAGLSKIAVERRHVKSRFLKAAETVLNHSAGRLPLVSGWAYTAVLNPRTYNAPFPELCAALEVAFAKLGDDKDAFEASQRGRAAPPGRAQPPAGRQGGDSKSGRPAGKPVGKPAPKVAPAASSGTKVLLKAKGPLLRRESLSRPTK
ncbi:hypothetical protein Q8F55_007470 [Vanrija albida]|uniref:Uncharacterized protein n=1 Tax=Vanrija albida TaxID=181172 RepID=A0ABR3PTL5_9TREE